MPARRTPPLFLLAGLGWAVPVFAAATALPPAAPPEIVAGLRSCLAATGATSVDVDRLRADGWRPLTRPEDGKPVVAPLRLLGKGRLLLVLDPQVKKPICLVTAGLADAGAIDAVATAVDHELAVTANLIPNDPNSLYYFPPGHLVQLTLTGTPTAPAVRVGVGPMP